MRWTVMGSRHVHRDRWISLRADDCVTPAGVSVSPYYVLEYPDFVGALVLDPGGHVVLVRQYRHGLGVVALELPGGLVDATDAGPVGAAVREVAEETGYAGGTARLLRTLSTDPAKMANRFHLVLIEGATRSRAVAPDPGEEIEVVAVPIAKAVDLALGGAIVNATQVGMLLTGQQAAGGHRPRRPQVDDCFRILPYPAGNRAAGLSRSRVGWRSCSQPCC